MSYDVKLVDDDGGVVTVEKHTEGATYAAGGTDRAAMSVTFNYSYFFYNEIDADDGLRWLDEKTAGDTIPVLEDAVDALGTDPHRDCQSYWCPSTGRAGAALATLLEWAEEHPEAEWRVV